MPSTISFEIWRFAGFLLVAVLIGTIYGQFWAAVALTLFAYVVWHMRKISLLYRWLKERTEIEPPEGSGIWGEVFDEFHQVQQQDQQHKQSLTTTLVRLQQVVSALPDGAIILHSQFEIEWCNQAAQRLLGIKIPNDLGYSITNLVRAPVFVEYLTKGDYADFVDMASPIDDTINLSVRVIPIDKNQRLLIVRDMTRIIRLEQMRKDFIANVSHELKTPLTVVNGYLEVFVDSEDASLQQWIPKFRVMHQQVERMQNIVTDLLLLSRLETKTVTINDAPVRVARLIQEINEEAKILSGEKRHQILTEVESSIELSGNADELHSAFLNLVSNAVRYTPAGGIITIRWFKQKASACFQVQDTGIGIEQYDIPRLTERFYRADVTRSRDTGGTGLGLAIVKHVMIRYDAHLHIESTIGKGSIFTCEFPESRVIDASAVTKVS